MAHEAWSMPDKKRERKGKWGRPPLAFLPSELPADVEERVNLLLNPATTEDWIWSGGWLVCRCWNDPENFQVIAAQVSYESKSIEVPKHGPK